MKGLTPHPQFVFPDEQSEDRGSRSIRAKTDELPALRCATAGMTIPRSVLIQLAVGMSCVISMGN